MRVQIPFGRGRSVGVLVEIARTTDFDPAKLKRVQAVLDTTPILPDDILAMARWAADYYHHPLGEVLAGCLPVLLRRDQALAAAG